MKNKFGFFSVISVFMIFAGNAQAGQCPEYAEAARIFEKAVTGELCPAGLAVTTEPRGDSNPWNQEDAMAKVMTVFAMNGPYKDLEQDPNSRDAMLQARAARRAYPGNVKVHEVRWRCGSGREEVWVKQVLLVGATYCEPVGPSFRYFSYPSRKSNRNLPTW